MGCVGDCSSEIGIDVEENIEFGRIFVAGVCIKLWHVQHKSE